MPEQGWRCVAATIVLPPTGSGLRNSGCNQARSVATGHSAERCRPDYIADTQNPLVTLQEEHKPRSTLHRCTQYTVNTCAARIYCR